MIFIVTLVIIGVAFVMMFVSCGCMAGGVLEIRALVELATMLCTRGPALVVIRALIWLCVGGTPLF